MDDSYSLSSLTRVSSRFALGTVGVLLEVIPLYNRYWTEYLSKLAYAQMALDLDASSWRRAWMYWKDCANFLDSREWSGTRHVLSVYAGLIALYSLT